MKTLSHAATVNAWVQAACRQAFSTFNAFNFTPKPFVSELAVACATAVCFPDVGLPLFGKGAVDDLVSIEAGEEVLGLSESSQHASAPQKAVEECVALLPRCYVIHLVELRDDKQRPCSWSV